MECFQCNIWYKSFDKGKVRPSTAGKYTVVDSDPKTGSNNAKSGNAGFFGIKWEPYGSPKYYPPDPAVPKATKVDTPSKTLDLGNEWTSSGGGWTCYWRRSPGTNTFSAVFTKGSDYVEDTFEIKSIKGNIVTLHRNRLNTDSVGTYSNGEIIFSDWSPKIIK